MHTNQTFNSLIIENLETLNLPEEIKPFVSTLKEISWTCMGLPAFSSKFTVSGNQLYFESGPDDKVDVRKEEFTGETQATCVVTPDNHDKIYVLGYSFVFCKGILCENKLLEIKTDTRANYDNGLNKFIASNDEMQRIFKSWWFRWLYKPYAFALTGLTQIVVGIFEFILRFFLIIVRFLLPIEF